jgi:hypothetical protein
LPVPYRSYNQPSPGRGRVQGAETVQIGAIMCRCGDSGSSGSPTALHRNHNRRAARHGEPPCTLAARARELENRSLACGNLVGEGTADG